MSNLIIVTASMHKIANVSIEVKYRHPGNVVAYIAVEFELYEVKGKYFAVPLVSIETRRILNLPAQFSFHVQNNVILVSGNGLKGVVKELVKKLSQLALIDDVQKEYLSQDATYSTEELLFT
ncbi:MAG: hypothetical protein ABI151_04095 [Chitinophagaceae bacterium]